MSKRFVTIWFHYLKTDWLIRRQPALSQLPFVIAAPDHGRMIITAASSLAEKEGIAAGMVVADARAIVPGLQVFDDQPALASRLLHAFAEWCIRFTPIVAVDLPDGLTLDVSGCPHLWNGEESYLAAIYSRFIDFGYHVRLGMADTIGTAWAVTRFGKEDTIIENGEHVNALLSLPPESLRLENETVERLHKLGLTTIGSFISMSRSALRRRFGTNFIQRLDQATGLEKENIEPVQPIIPYQERLPCLEPIVTATGIEIALQQLLDTLCKRLEREGKGLRQAQFRCYRVDHKKEQVSIGTIYPSHHAAHLFKLFEEKLSGIEPALGIELFILEAPKVEDAIPKQERLWERNCNLGNTKFSELIDRIANKIGNDKISRFVPVEHYWPERSIKAATLQEEVTAAWLTDKPRPIQLLSKPERVEVTAPIPDYPPMLFRYNGKLHTIKKADGPERIEREWWLDDGEHRDYYIVEDENGHRYWLFRSGHYTAARNHQWFIHGFFA
ncbi:MAG: DNA polymerase Y family protein [Bacteroidetes bacterium]|nr:DNA polymerase Y family protein [Bacteroidota bacterium]